MEKKKKETKIQELERRIRDLDNRNIQFVPYPPPAPIPSQITQGLNRCPVCGDIFIGNYHYCVRIN